MNASSDVSSEDEREVESLESGTSFGELNVGFGGKKDLLLLSPLADDVDEKRRVADSILMA